MPALLIVLLELLSFFGWALPQFGSIAWFIILCVVLVATLHDLRIGIAVMFAELAIGSHGYLFAFTYEGLTVSLRIGLFLVITSIAFVRAIQQRRLAIWMSPYRRPLIGLLAVVCYAIVRGWMQGNGFANIFFDANAFLFFGSALALWQGLQNTDDIYFVLKITAIAVLTSVGKALLLLYMFSHKLWWALPEVYRWVRDTRIGELTQMTDTFFRIFFQSQIYVVMAFFVVLTVFVAMVHTKGWRASIGESTGRKWLIVLTVLMASTLISLSRSNWMGMVVAFLCMPLWLWKARQPIIVWMRNASITVIGSVLGSLVLIAGIVLVPFPPSGGAFSASLFGSRALTFDQEAGVGSRWALLPPLWSAIRLHPVLGQGFGTEVTYKTEDPRLLAQNPTGDYTTFIFEWGYHDLWLKLGLFGLVAYAYLLIVIVRSAWQYVGLHADANRTFLVIGLMTGCISLLVTHTTSPYINHPLGISYLLFCAVCIDVFRRQSGFIDRTEERS